MANKEIAQLTVAEPLDGTELVHVVQGGSSRQTTAAKISAAPNDGVLDTDFAIKNAGGFKRSFDCAGQTADWGVIFPDDDVDLTSIGKATVVGSPEATTSGTSKLRTGIPAGVTEVKVMFNGVSFTGTSGAEIQIGSSDGLVATGYNGAGTRVTSAGVSTTGATTGFRLPQSNSSHTVSGCVTLSLFDVTNNIWVANGALSDAASGISLVASGSVALSGPIERVGIKSVNGTDPFDLGSWNVSWS
jgi:hypothetical protein